MARKANHGSRVNVNGKPLRMSTTGELEIQLDKIKKYLTARIPGIVISRTRKGIDQNGKPFRAYSENYARLKGLAGRTPGANLWLTGGMVGSFALRSHSKDAHGLHLFFAPDSAQSPTLLLTEDGAKQGSGVTPPHNTLAGYHQKGVGNLPRRKWIGLTRAESKKLAKEIEKLSGFWRLRK